MKFFEVVASCCPVPRLEPADCPQRINKAQEVPSASASRLGKPFAFRQGWYSGKVRFSRLKGARATRDSPHQTRAHCVTKCHQIRPRLMLQNVACFCRFSSGEHTSENFPKKRPCLTLCSCCFPSLLQHLRRERGRDLEVVRVLRFANYLGGFRALVLRVSRGAITSAVGHLSIPVPCGFATLRHLKKRGVAQHGHTR